MENILLLAAVCFCGCCAVLSFMMTNRRRTKMIVSVLWCLSASLIAFATALMIVYQILSRFEYQYVYSHTDKNTALIYKISSLWSGQEGSFLLWALILGIMGFFVLRIKGKGSNRVFGIYASISFCIFLMCFIAGPFAKLSGIPADGLGLNEALKDPWMVIHPPLVFIAYSAMAVLFAYSAINDNAGNRIPVWLRISWFFLGIGILTGSIWAYRALGWGGYWAWDPIENAALVPWLVLCGYLHSNDYNRRSVCMVPFSLAVFGVFLARSGILKDRSAHAYTEGSIIITVIILSFIIVSVLYLAFSKIRKSKIENVKKDANYNKRLITYSINGYAALILIGTVAPVILNIEIPVIYYTAISIIFALTYSILLLKWDFGWLKRRNILMIAVSTVFVIGIMALTGSKSITWLLLIWVCLMPLSLWLVCRFRTQSPRYYLSHLGVLFLIIGAITSSALGKDVSVKAVPDKSNVIVAGIAIPITELIEEDTLIKTLPQADLVIQCSGITPLPQGGILISYATKPLIILFWAGCFMIIVQPLINIILKRFGKT